MATPWQVTEEEYQKDNYIKRIVEEAGFRFLDGNYYAEEMGLEYNVDFYNPKHTNAIGAAKFTTYLGKGLEKQKDFCFRQDKGNSDQRRFAFQFQQNGK